MNCLLSYGGCARIVNAGNFGGVFVDYQTLDGAAGFERRRCTSAAVACVAKCPVNYAHVQLINVRKVAGGHGAVQLGGHTPATNGSLTIVSKVKRASNVRRRAALWGDMSGHCRRAALKGDMGRHALWDVMGGRRFCRAALRGDITFHSKATFRTIHNIYI